MAFFGSKNIVVRPSQKRLLKMNITSLRSQKLFFVVKIFHLHLIRTNCTHKGPLGIISMPLPVDR